MESVIQESQSLYSPWFRKKLYKTEVRKKLHIDLADEEERRSLCELWGVRELRSITLPNSSDVDTSKGSCSC